MEQLKDEQAILNLIGKNNVVNFKYATEGILTYCTAVPKEIGEYTLYFEIEVFYNLDTTFFDFETLEDLMHKKQVFRVNTKDLIGDREEIYFRDYNQN